MPSRLGGWWKPAAAYAVSRLAVLLAQAAGAAASTELGLRQMILTWDSGWYLSIVERGYQRQPPTGQSNIAFFPLYPYLARAVAALPVVGAVDALALVALAAGLLATCLLWGVTRDLWDEPSADRAAALFAFAPGAFVFSLLYSEGVFLAAAIAACWALVRRHHLLGGVLAALGTAARPNGVALVLVALTSVVVVVRERGRLRSAAPAVAALGLAPLGFVAYLAFTWHHTGQADSWFVAQRLGWQERFGPGGRLDDAVAVWQAVAGGPPDWNRIVAAVGLVVSVVAFVALLRAEPPPELVAFTVGIAVLALTSATLGMRPRFVLTAFPLVIGLGVWLRHSFAFSLVLAASASAAVALAVVSGTTLYLTP